MLLAVLVLCRHRPRMRGRTGCVQATTMQPVGRSSGFTTPKSIIPGKRAPGRLWGMSPHPRGAKRRPALVRIAAPGGRLAVGPVPSAEGNGRPHDAGRRAFRRFTAAFSLDLETAFWKRT